MRAALTVRNEMLNGTGEAAVAYYSLADSCLAFASNSHGIRSVSVETSISHTRQVKEGDVLTATAVELQRGERFARYDIRVTDQQGKDVALFRGTVFRTGEPWFPDQA
jgi:acyl-CoA thioesterase